MKVHLSCEDADVGSEPRTLKLRDYDQPEFHVYLHLVPENVEEGLPGFVYELFFNQRIDDQVDLLAHVFDEDTLAELHCEFHLLCKTGIAKVENF